MYGRYSWHLRGVYVLAFGIGMLVWIWKYLWLSGRLVGIEFENGSSVVALWLRCSLGVLLRDECFRLVVIFENGKVAGGRERCLDGAEFCWFWYLKVYWYFFSVIVLAKFEFFFLGELFCKMCSKDWKFDVSKFSKILRECWKRWPSEDNFSPSFCFFFRSIQNITLFPLSSRKNVLGKNSLCSIFSAF